MIVGLAGRGLLRLVFNDAGELVDQSEHDFPIRPLNVGGVNLEWLDLVFRERVERERKALGTRDATIHVRRFMLPNLRIGIEDLADQLQDYLRNPESFSASERVELDEVLRAWRSQGLYVFWWQQSFEVGGDGMVVSS
jgi:hypothetical protein